MSRRLRLAFFLGATALLGGLGGCVLLHELGAASSEMPESFAAQASPAARALVERAFAGLDPARLLDHHVHLAGLGTDGSGSTVQPEVFSWLHPKKRVQFLVYTRAAGVRDFAHADRQFVERLTLLTTSSPVPIRCALLAFDGAYTADGRLDEDASEIRVPNEWAARVAAERPELFVPVISLHPCRADAVAELERWAKQGVRLVKWLPNSMNIDPADARCDAFYAALARLDMTLLTHAGEEQAVDAGERQELGNPLRLRRPLEQGVRVVVAHCASLGEGIDLDHPGAGRVANFELFLRLMDEPRYAGRVFGEISAVCFSNREPGVLRTLLRRTELHERLVHGSDYPLPAINVLVSTRKLVREGFLTAEEREALNEVYEHNPLLFDLVLKRTLRGTGGERFADEVFHEREWMGKRR